MTIEIQRVVVTPGSTAQTTNLIFDGFKATATASAVIYPLPDFLGGELELGSIPSVGGYLRVHTSQLALLPQEVNLTGEATLQNRYRTMPGLAYVMSTPVMVAGRPMQARYYFNSDSTKTINQTTGHIQNASDPNPIWDVTNNNWLVSPPLGGAGDYRWTVVNFPDPASYGGQVKIGDRSSKDLTTSVPTSCTGWYPDASTPSAPVWKSGYPFKPELTELVHINKDGTRYVLPKALRFDPHFAQCMWMDTGTSKKMPFTWIFVGLVNEYAGGIQRHTLLDSGRSPFTYVSGRTEDNAAYGTTFPGKREGLGYRTLISVDRHSMYVTNNDKNFLMAKHPGNYKPRMYYGIFDTTHTRIGNLTTGGRNDFTGKLPAETLATTHRNYSMGRLCGYITSQYAAAMHVFEVRYWNRALTPAEISAQYTQLASTWHFSWFR